MLILRFGRLCPNHHIISLRHTHIKSSKSRKTHRIPLHAPVHPRCKVPVSPDINVQAIGLVAPASFIGRHVRLAVVLGVAGRARVHDLDDDGPIDLIGGVGGGGGAVEADVVDAVAGAALHCCWGARGWNVVG